MNNIDKLSIGNWVTDGDKGFPMFIQALYDVDTVYLDFEGNEGDTWEVDIKDIRPIRIDIEVIAKSEFKRDFDESIEYYGYTTNREGVKSDLMSIGEGKYLLTVTTEKYKNQFEIEYVHQLQNILSWYYKETFKIEL